MSKPTLFFSHSSKDKELIIKLKDKLMQYTGSVLNIFMSSDGQSIPAGTNWVHKIEEGLNEAKIMFVFVTKNSLSSGWIYFEAGFAYSKSIRVIPVGIGIDIGALKAPLNLLQGFNLTSEDSLNNLITRINEEFHYTFSDQFSRTDYDFIMSGYLETAGEFIPLDDVVKSISYSLYGKKRQDGKDIYIQNGDLFDKIEQFLIDNQIKYSKTNRNLLVLGLKIECLEHAESAGIEAGIANYNFYQDLKIQISPYNFEKSFALYLHLNELFEASTQFYLSLYLNDGWHLVGKEEDSSARLLEYPSRFEQDRESVGVFVCHELNLSFKIIGIRNHRGIIDEYRIGISYQPSTLNPANIAILVNWLIEAKVIFPN